MGDRYAVFSYEGALRITKESRGRRKRKPKSRFCLKIKKYFKKATVSHFRFY